MKRSGMPRRKIPWPRSRKRIRAVNPKRHAANQQRAYGPSQRRSWVKSLPCCWCGIEGYSDQAHVCGNDGASRKGEARTVAPLCHDRFDVVGCHTKYDRRKPPFDVESARETVQRHATRIADEWDAMQAAA